MSHQQLPKRARVALPPWMWGGHPKKFLDAAGLIRRREGHGVFSVETTESYLRNDPSLVRLRTIAQPAGLAPGWDDLSRLTERIEIDLPEQFARELHRRKIRAEERGELIDLFNHQTLLLQGAPPADLPSLSRAFVETLNSVTFADDPSDGPFANTWMHLIDTQPALLHRLKLASVLLRTEQDPTLASGMTTHLHLLDESRAEAFSASAGLYSGVLTFEPYLSPLLAAGTPGVWAINVTRSFGAIVFSLGTFVAGTEGHASELLQLVTTPGAEKPTHFPRLSPAAPDGALQWWTQHLNRMFSVLSDLAIFTDKDGNYRPAKHLEALLTIEQIFRRTTSMLVAHRDTHARRTLLFTILDSLEGVRGVNILKMFTLRHARKVLTGLENSIQAPAGEILLPAARRAVAALEETQEGFFLRRQLDSMTVDIRGEQPSSLSPEDATAFYLKALRDATHGHGSNRDATKARTAALLAHHNGNIPHDVGLLGYLYLLDMLAQPKRLRRLLFRGGK